MDVATKEELNEKFNNLQDFMDKIMEKNNILLGELNSFKSDNLILNKKVMKWKKDKIDF